MTPMTQVRRDAAPAREPLLRVTELVKTYPLPGRGMLGRSGGEIQAVSGVSLDVYPGETLGLVGESGCGKSTLGRTILLLERPTSGSIRFDGQEVTALRPRQLRGLRRRMQLVLQDPYSSLNPRMTAGQIVGEPLVVHGIGTARDRPRRIAELLERVGLGTGAASRYPHEFSGGQRQRIGIARALAASPALVICDEPVSALDVSIQAQILNLLTRLRDELGLTYLFVSHNLGVVKHIADRVAVMYLGRIAEVAPVDEFFGNARHPYSRALLSAIPVPDPDRERSRARIVLDTDLPSPANPPRGCRFHTRCPLARDVCREQAPPVETIAPGHRVACHFWKEGVA
jgi:oligopeptide/dipeptide ABC transporter ATP-binding protein